MIEFSSVSMPISAPGGDQVLKLLEELDRRGQAVVEKLGAMSKAKGLWVPERLAPVKEAGEAAKHSAANFEHLGVKAAFAANALAQGAENGVKPFAHQLALLGGTFGPVALAVTTFVAIAGESLISWFMTSREEAEKLEKQLDTLERQIGRADLIAAGKELQAIFSGDKYRDGDDVISKLIRSGGIQKLQQEIEDLNEKSKAGLESARKASSASMGQAVLGETQSGATALLEQKKKELAELTDYHERIQKVFDEKVRLFGSVEAAKAQIERERKAEEERKAFHDEVVDGDLAAQNERNRLMREAYQRETDETLRVLEEGWKKEQDARDRHDKAVIQGARELAGDTASVIASAVDGFLSGNFGDGLNALKDAVLERIGEILIGIGTTMIAASPLLKAASAALLTLSGGGSLAAGLGLVALGATLVSASNHGGGGGGGSYVSGAGGGSSLGSQMVSVMPYGAPDMSGVRAASPVTVNATFIGKHDPKAGRELLEMIDYHQRTRRS